MKPYVVQDGFRYLQLDGPFAYPKWTPTLESAQVFSYSNACAWAAAHGGIVVPYAGAASPYAGVA